MKRDDAHRPTVSMQVSSTVGRMGEIKLIPTLWRWGNMRGGATEIAGASKKTNNIDTRRYDVGEILLEDVCICVDAGVWNDLLGDQVGAVFSPEFRLEVKIGPQVGKKLDLRCSASTSLPQ